MSDSPAMRGLVLFDWDDTLVDSGNCPMDAWRRSQESDDARDSKYRGLKMSPRDLARLASESHRLPPDPMLRRFRAELLAQDFDPIWMPGALAALRCLSADGFKFGVVSGRDRVRLDSGLRGARFEGMFEVTIAGDEAAKKPSPEPILRCLERTSEDRRRVIFVGDSLADAECACAAGVHGVIVGEENALGGIAHHLTSLSLLPALVAAILQTGSNHR